MLTLPIYSSTRNYKFISTGTSTWKNAFIASSSIRIVCHTLNRNQWKVYFLRKIQDCAREYTAMFCELPGREKIVNAFDLVEEKTPKRAFLKLTFSYPNRLTYVFDIYARIFV